MLKLRALLTRQDDLIRLAARHRSHDSPPATSLLPPIRPNLRRGALSYVGRTKRRQKLDKRSERELQQEIARRTAAGEPVVVLKGPKTKTRPASISLGEPVDTESDFAERLEKARAFLHRLRSDEPAS
jgi:hypothetical protein